jgi:hypothetical protein
VHHPKLEDGWHTSCADCVDQNVVSGTITQGLLHFRWMSSYHVRQVKGHPYKFMININYYQSWLSDYRQFIEHLKTVTRSNYCTVTSSLTLQCITAWTKFSQFAVSSRLPLWSVVRIPGYRSRGPGSISGTTRFSEK